MGFCSGIFTWYVQQAITKPRTTAMLGLLIPVLISVIAFAAYPLELDSSGGNWYPRDSRIGGLEDTIKISEEQTVFNPLVDKDQIDNIQYPLGTVNADLLNLVFWTGNSDGTVQKDKNLLTDVGIGRLRDIERYITTEHESGGRTFKDICLKNIAGDCEVADGMLKYWYAEEVCEDTWAPESTLEPGVVVQFAVDDAQQKTRGLMYGHSDVSAGSGNGHTGTNGSMWCTGVGDAEADDQDDLTCRVGCIPPSTASTKQLLVKSFDVAEFDSFATRMQIRMGLPLEGYKSAEDNYDEQKLILDKWAVSLKTYLDKKAPGHGIVVRYYNEALLTAHFDGVIARDSAMVVISIVLVWSFIFLHTQSLLIASVGMLHIILSFPFAYFFLQVFLDIGGMGLLNFMALFIILGIGADDIFIFVDAWKQSAIVKPRAKYGDGDAGDHDWLTARLDYSYRRSAFSMLVTSFTTSAAFMMNLTSSVPPIQIFGFFTAFMVLTNYLMVITYFPALVIVWHKHGEPCFRWCCEAKPEGGDVAIDGRSTEAGSDNNGSSGSSKPKQRAIERFFEHTYAPWIHRHALKVVGAFVVFVVLSIAFAAQLSPSEEPSQWLKASDPMQQMFKLEATAFESSTYPVQGSFVHGLRPLDRDGTNPYNAEDIGDMHLDTRFDPSSPGFQLTYVAFCQRLRKLNYVLDNEVYCPLDDFQLWLENLNETFPVPDAQFEDRLAEFVNAMELEFGPAPDFGKDADATSRANRRYGPQSIVNTIRWHPTTGKLAYLAAIANLTIRNEDTNNVLEPAYNYFEREMKKENGRAEMRAATLGNGFQQSVKWVDYELEKVLLASALIGIGASLAIAYVIIFLSTGSSLLTTMAVGTIGCTVATLIATLVWIGWEMSLLESICLTILVGLSVDYTIHLANAWGNSKATTRLEKTQHMLGEIGISVFAASITTFLSAVALFACTVLFFFKFGVFIALTIIISMVYAFLLFTALVALVGPLCTEADWTRIHRCMTGGEGPTAGGSAAGKGAINPNPAKHLSAL